MPELNEEGQELLAEVIEKLYPEEGEPQMCYVCPILPKDLLERLRNLYDEGQLQTFFERLESGLAL